MMIVPSHWGPEVDLVPSTPGLHDHDHHPGEPPHHLRRALHRVAGDYDAVLIDCPPSLGQLTTSGLTAADLAVIVVDPAALGLRGIGAVADAIDHVWDNHNADLELAGVIVNRCRPSAPKPTGDTTNWLESSDARRSGSRRCHNA